MPTIGTARPEEARVWDSEAGYHQFTDEAGGRYGSFEVFWSNGDGDVMHEDGSPLTPGWYWAAGLAGCIWDGEPEGPFPNSWSARQDADEFWDMPTR